MTEAEAGVTQPQAREVLEHREWRGRRDPPEDPQKVIRPCPWCCRDTCSNVLGRACRGRKRTDGASGSGGRFRRGCSPSPGEQCTPYCFHRDAW